MAYDLQLPSGGRVDIPKPPRSGFKFEFEIYIETITSAIPFLTCKTSDSNYRFWFRMQGDGRIQCQFFNGGITYNGYIGNDTLAAGWNTVAIYIHFTNNVPCILEINGTDSSADLMSSGGVYDSDYANYGDFCFLASRFSSSLSGMSNVDYDVLLRSVTVSEWNSYSGSIGDLIHLYDKQSLSGPNDIILPDTIGNADGTLVNTSNDNSQWVYYSSGGGVEQDVTAIDSQHDSQSEVQSVIQSQNTLAISSQQLSENEQQKIHVTHAFNSSQVAQLNEYEQKNISVVQSLSSLKVEQPIEPNKATVQMLHQIERGETQQNADAENNIVALSQSVKSVYVKYLAQAEQSAVQDGGGITADDAQQQSEAEQKVAISTQAVSANFTSQLYESVKITVTQTQQINAVEGEQFSQAQQSFITDGNGIASVKVEQKSEAQVLEVTQKLKCSNVEVEQRSQTKQTFLTISQILVAAESEQQSKTTALQVSDSDIIIEPQKISFERVTPTFTTQLVKRPKYTIQLVKRPKYTIVRL